MSKLIIGASMVFTGLLGLFATACGLVFLVIGFVAEPLIIGIIPGALMLWLTTVLWRDFRSSPPAAETPRSPSDREENS